MISMIALLLPTRNFLEHNTHFSNNSTSSNKFDTNRVFEILVKSENIVMIFLGNLRTFEEKKFKKNTFGTILHLSRNEVLNILLHLHGMFLFHNVRVH